MSSDKDVKVGGTPTTPADAAQSTPSCGDLSKREVASIRSEILSFLVDETRPAALPEKWRFLRPSPSVRQLPGDRSELATKLQQSFPIEALSSARVLRRHPDHGLQWSSVLGADSSKFIVIFDENKRPIDAVNARGRLSSPDPPCLQHHLKGNSQVHRQGVIVASNDDDLHVLHQLEFECTSAAGLERLSTKHAGQLFGPGSSYYNQRKRVFLLAGWQIAEVVNQPSPFIQRVFSRMWKIEELHGLDSSRTFNVWWPSEKHFDQIQSAVEIADAKLALSILSQNLTTPRLTPAETWNKLLENADADLPLAYAGLLRAIRRSEELTRPTELRVARERLRRCIESSVVGKFYSDADATSDPLEKMLLLAGSEFAEHFFETQLLQAAAQRAADGDHTPYRGVMHKGFLEERLRIADALTKIRRQLLRDT